MIRPLLLTLLLLSACSSHRYARWDKVELTFEGPRSAGRGDPNPFAVPFDVIFTSPTGKTYKVPGFYDGDGRGGLDGNVWKARFSPDENGSWSYRSESTDTQLNARSGSFTVSDPPKGTSGRLEYVGQPYLKFREGGYWVKFGADEPENLLGKAFGAGDWESKKRQIDYLASKRINAVYIMTHNLEGDEKDVWPWLGDTSEEAKRNHLRFDVARLDKWRDLFEYIQSKNIVIHLVLEDDSAWTGYDHARYYREIVARFGYLNALYFNLGEEHNENYSLAEALGYMKLLSEIDPYNHPRAIHNVNAPRAEYIDSRYVDLASIQTSPGRPSSLNQLAVDWWQACLTRRQRPLVVSFDEARPPEDRQSWWSVYTGGGMWESLILVPAGYAATEPVWEQLAIARTFFEPLPLERMHPANAVVTKGEAFCLALPGEIYAFYLPAGGAIEVDLTGGNQYAAEWFDPRSAARKDGGKLTGGLQKLAAPDAQDWALLIRKTAGNSQAPPWAVSGQISSKQNQTVPLRLALLGAERAAKLEYEIVTPPRHGKLTGEAADRIYAPNPGFTGRDHFQWRVKTGGGTSNAATVLITANATGINVPPRVQDQNVTLRANQAQTFILQYTDPDGPGPYRVRIARPPKHGATQGIDNDVTYTPADGFRGSDAFEWDVHDGETRSKRATVSIKVQ
jgi:hypothetical protein